MRIFFDVDLTLLNTNNGTWTLRPGAQDILAFAKNNGHDVYLWSASGFEHCQRFAKTYGFEGLITDYFDKEPRVPVKPDVVVDDDEFLVQKWKGVHVQPFRDITVEDRELFNAMERIDQFVKSLQQ